MTQNVQLFAFGDIHGELNGFKENLREAGLINSRDHWKRDCSAIALQMGDVYDRGPKSEESDDFLDRLQREANGHVIRLIGNHELMILERNYDFALPYLGTIEKCEQTRKKLIANIELGRIQLAWTDNKRLFVHAGVRSKIAKQLKAQIAKSKAIRTSAVSFQDMTDALNQLLKTAVRTNDFSHPIFLIGKSRGGDAEIGGVVWEDIQCMLQSAHARGIPQVIAHNPPISSRNLIRATDSMRLICIDAGMCQHYGGNRAFIHFENDRVFFHEKQILPKSLIKRIIDFLLFGFWKTPESKIWRIQEFIDPIKN